VFKHHAQNKFSCPVWAVLLLAPIAYGDELSDPTMPLVHKAATAIAIKEDRSLHLGSVIISPESKIAIINGRRYKELDVVGDYKLVSIRPKVVTLKKSREKLQLRLSSMAFEEGE